MTEQPRKSRIVFGIGDLGIGGAERLTVQIIKRLDPEKFECILITLFEHEGDTFLDELPAHIFVHQLAFSGFSDIRSWIKLYRLLRSIRPAVVVSNLFFSNTVFRVLKPFAGYQVITCEHNTYVNKTKMQQRVDRVLSHFSYRIVAVSKTVAKFTAKQEGIEKDKFIVIPNGIDIQAWQTKLAELPSRDILRKELGFCEDDFVVLTVARLVPQKNQKLLLDGFAEFHENHDHSKLAIVGDGFLREALQKQSEELGLAESVFFFGARRDVERFYKAGDVFALTSDIEGFGLVGIEAMSAGLPVISTDTAGPDEYVEDTVNGLLIRDRSAHAIAESMQSIVEGDVATLRNGALQTAAGYDLRSSVKLYEHLFEQVLKAP